MNFFAIASYVIFSITLINHWLEKFLLYQEANYGYLWRKFFSVTCQSQFDQHDVYQKYTNSVITVLTFFGLNAILHSFEINVLLFTFVMCILNVICFVIHSLYICLLPYHISQDYSGVAFGYNMLMWIYLNYVYFLTPSHSIYFTYFVILTIPHLFRACFNLVDQHYIGDSVVIKTLEIYLNYF